jgi:hypothetical protein
MEEPSNIIAFKELLDFTAQHPRLHIYPGSIPMAFTKTNSKYNIQQSAKMIKQRQYVESDFFFSFKK